MNEPSVATNGAVVIETYNTYAAISGDSGVTFTYFDPTSIFNSTSTVLCCDQRVVFDPGRNVFIWVSQFGAGGAEPGFERLAVATPADALALRWTYWDIAAKDITGSSASDVSDYPQLGLSANYAYLTVNYVTAGATSPYASGIFRLSLDQLARRAALGWLTYFRIGGTITPVQGATSTMYFGRNDSTGVMTLVAWPETGNMATMSISHDLFAAAGVTPCYDPDSHDLCGHLDSRVMSGWVANGIIGFAWSAGAGGPFNHPNAYVQLVRIGEATRTVIDEPAIWSDQVAYAVPTTAVNARGEVAIGLTFTSRTRYPSAAVTLLDASTAPPSFFILNVREGSGGAIQDRWGDFQTITTAGPGASAWFFGTYTKQGSSVETLLTLVGRDASAPVPTATPTPTSQPTTPPTPTAAGQARSVLVSPSELTGPFGATDHDYTFAEKAAAVTAPPIPYRSWSEALTGWGWQLGSNRDLFNAAATVGVFEVASTANFYSSSAGASSAYAYNLTALAATTGTPYSTSPLGSGLGEQSAAYTRLTTLSATTGGQLPATELVFIFRAGRVSNVLTLFSYPSQMDTALGLRLAQQQAIRAALFNPTITPTPSPTPTVAPGTASCNSSTGPGIPGPQGLATGIDGWHAAWYGQSGYPTLCPGQQSTATVAFLNTGTNGWVLGRAGQTAYLGTWGPEPGQDQPSPLGGDGAFGSPNTGWPVYNRVAIQPASYVGPGQVAWFQFTIQAPVSPGTYRLALRALIEGTQWLEDYGVFWYVTVKPATGVPTPTPTPTLPPGAGATPTPPPTTQPTPTPTRISGATVSTRQTSFSPQEGVIVDWTNPSPAVGDYVTFAHQDTGGYEWIWTLEPAVAGEVTLRPAGLAPGVYQLRMYTAANVLLAVGPYVTVR